jgi:hypothetical protein
VWIRFAVLIPGFLAAGVAIWAGRLISSTRNVDYITIPRRLRERITDRAAFSRIIGTGLFVEGLMLLIALLLLVASPRFGGTAVLICLGAIALIHGVMFYRGKRYIGPRLR